MALVEAPTKKSVLPELEKAHPPRPFVWSRKDYHTLDKLPVFFNRRVELIEGEIVEMSPIGFLHILGVAKSAKAVEVTFGSGYFVLTQSPFAAGNFSEPEPDAAVYAGTLNNLKATPTNPALIIEVSDATLAYDRTTKAGLYARAGIADYWVLNIRDRVLEVFRNPLNGVYEPKVIYRPGQNIAPLAAPQSLVLVDDLLP